MSAPATATCAAKGGEAKRMMKYDPALPPKLVLISPLIKKAMTPHNPAFACGCTCWEKHLCQVWWHKKSSRDP